MPTPLYIVNISGDSRNQSSDLSHFISSEHFQLLQFKEDLEAKNESQLWTVIQKIVQKSLLDEAQCVVLLDPYHEFSEKFSVEEILDSVEQLSLWHADVLVGGIEYFSSAIPVSSQYCWVDSLRGARFLIIFSRLYKHILNAGFDKSDSFLEKLSSISSRIFLRIPFISSHESYTDAEASVTTVYDIALFYRNTVHLKENELLDEFYVPTYVINLPERPERKKHILSQFSGRNEFDMKIFDAIKHKIGAYGLWLSICAVVKDAIEENHDVIIICEDDHEFTKEYSKEFLFSSIVQGHFQGLDYMLGGTAGIDHALPVTQNLFWGTLLLSGQFMIIYKKFFSKILNQSVDETVVADRVFSTMTINKTVIYPFISVQRDFGFSDVSEIHNQIPGFLTSLFASTNQKLKKVHQTYVELVQHHNWL